MTQKSNSSSASGGVGFFGLLTIVFIVLKLTHFINWSWWWVTAPSWAPLAFIIVLAIAVLLVVGLVKLFAWLAVKVIDFVTEVYDYMKAERDR